MINVGDKVRHKDDNMFNAKGAMQVQVIDKGYAFCSKGGYNGFGELPESYPLNDLRLFTEQDSIKKNIVKHTNQDEVEDLYSKIIHSHKGQLTTIQSIKLVEACHRVFIDNPNTSIEDKLIAGRIYLNLILSFKDLTISSDLNI